MLWAVLLVVETAAVGGSGGGWGVEGGGLVEIELAQKARQSTRAAP